MVFAKAVSSLNFGLVVTRAKKLDPFRRVNKFKVGFLKKYDPGLLDTYRPVRYIKQNYICIYIVRYCYVFFYRPLFISFSTVYNAAKRKRNRKKRELFLKCYFLGFYTIMHKSVLSLLLLFR